MPLSGCSQGLALTALAALLLVPGPYLVPDLVPAPKASPGPRSDVPSAPPTGLDLGLDTFPPFDLALTTMVLMIGITIYFCQWIQRKFLEYRIVKLNKSLGASVERLRAWDSQQEQVEATLRMVQDATAEYELLLYLVLRHHHCLAPPHDGPQSNCFFDKELLDEDLAML